MSKTFTSNPSTSNSLRGRGTGRARGTGTVTRPGVEVGRPPANISQSTASRQSRMNNSSLPKSTFGEDQRQSHNRVGAPPLGQIGVRSRSRPNIYPNTAGTSGVSSVKRGLGRMNNTHNRGTNFDTNDDNTGVDRERAQQQPNDSQGRGQYAGGYTMFSPNEKKRRQVEEMARRETQAYEQYRQANAGKNYNYVGAVGGGDRSEDQVRARQANEVRAQKYNRLMKQDQHRQAAKQAEEEAIQKRKEEARRKAEQNAIRTGRVPAAEEVRRKRESFLAQLESGSQATGSQETHVSPPRTKTNNSTNMRGNQTVMTPSSSSRQHTGRFAENRNNNSHQSTPPRPTVAQAQQRLAEHGPKPNPRVNQSPRLLSGNHVDSAPPEVKVEPPLVKHEQAEEEDSSNHTHSQAQFDEEINILISMYPRMSVDELKNLLTQVGSLDAAIEVLE